MRLFGSLPALALIYIPVLLGEIDKHWPEFGDPPIMAGQIEQETCFSLTNKNCWNPNVELKTSREYGFGLGQITIAYNEDGSERFNTFTEVKELDASLAAWEWQNRYKADMQLRALVIKNRFNASRVEAATTDDHILFMLYAYNGGLGALLGDISRCRQKEGCDPLRWFGNVELTSNKSKKPFGGAYGGASAWSISHEYGPRIYERSEKYRDYIHEIENNLCPRGSRPDVVPDGEL